MLSLLSQHQKTNTFHPNTWPVLSNEHCHKNPPNIGQKCISKWMKICQYWWPNEPKDIRPTLTLSIGPIFVQFQSSTWGGVQWDVLFYNDCWAVLKLNSFQWFYNDFIDKTSGRVLNFNLCFAPTDPFTDWNSSEKHNPTVCRHLRQKDTILTIYFNSERLFLCTFYPENLNQFQLTTWSHFRVNSTLNPFNWLTN